MTNKELHNLVNEYWIFMEKEFKPYYLHMEIDAGHPLTTNSVYEEFIKYVNKNYDK
jgi:hypothetical protein